LLVSRALLLAVSGLPASLALLGCGARSQLDVGGVTGSGSSAPAGACPAAVSGPKPMAGNCSTRDGRSRVAGPSAPHVTWTVTLPTDSTGEVGPGTSIATDAAGHAYVVTTGEIGETLAALRRVDAADGTIDWTDPISPDEETDTPIVLASGGVDMFAYSKNTDAVFTFDPSSGASTSTTFGVSLYDAPKDLAVGVDGSLYVTHADGVGGAHQTTFVSRVAPGGEVLWTSVDLGTLGPTPVDDGEVDPSIIALGQDDLVVIVVGVLAAGGQQSTVANAFDPATGATRWSTTLPGGPLGGPMIRPDGTIVAMTNAGNSGDLVILDPGTGAATTAPLPTGVFEAFAVTEGGAVIGALDAALGGGIIAFGVDGTTLWTNPNGDGATIASDGTIITFGLTIAAIDGATGETAWELAPPGPHPCIMDGALTSDGGIVALLCGGTLFGASD
jgi:hypothetical protein